MPILSRGFVFAFVHGIALIAACITHAETIGFELEQGFDSGADIASLNSWKGSGRGVGKVSDAFSKDGSQCLQILARSGEQPVGRKFPLAKDGIVFVDFWILPTADPSTSPLSTADINGAVLGFVKEGVRGTVMAVSNVKTGASTATGYLFDIDERNLAVDWVRVTIRQDTKAKTWDLFLDNRLVLIDQPLDGTPKFALLCIYPNPVGPAYIDDLTISETNPLFPDQDKDDIPDAVEVALGVNPNFNDRGLRFNASDPTNIEKFLLIGSHSNRSINSESRVVYVDNNLGDDKNSGALSYRVLAQGPKATLGAALKLADSKTTIVLLPSKKSYLMPAHGQSVINLLPLGNVYITNQ
jgi:hypothetical protein